jgi:hypothetical protein
VRLKPTASLADVVGRSTTALISAERRTFRRRRSRSADCQDAPDKLKYLANLIVDQSLPFVSVDYSSHPQKTLRAGALHVLIKSESTLRRVQDKTRPWRTAFGGLPSEQRATSFRVGSVRQSSTAQKVVRTGALLTQQIVGVHQLAEAQRQAATSDTAA